MQEAYLINGQKCYIKLQIGDRLVINKVFEHTAYFGNYDDTFEDTVYLEGNDEIVDIKDVFENPPKAVFDSEIIELESKIKVLKDDLLLLKTDKQQLENEVRNIHRTKVDSERFIINRSDIMKAKEIVLFPKDHVMPMIKKSEDKSMRGLKVSFDISISEGKERAWGYKLYHEYNDNYSQYLCEKYGILIDPTQEEIDEVIVKRLSELKFDDRQISFVDDKYLTAEQIQTKTSYKQQEKQKSIESNKKQIAELKARIKNLENPDLK